MRRGFPPSSVGKESACSAGEWVRLLGLEDPLEKEMATYSSILAWKIPMDIGAWQATVRMDSMTQETGQVVWYSHL